MESFAWCKRFTQKSLSQAYGLPVPFSRKPECKKPPLKGRGTVVRRWRIFCGIFYLMYQVSQKHPSVKPTACQLSTRHALRVPFQGSLFLKKSSQTKRASPTGSLPCRDALFQANRIYFAAASFSARFSQTFARSTASYKFGRSEVLVIAFTGSGSLVAI